ncbi:hypothetical protein [Nocardioides sp.]|uniref:hypothetical protein n=1 Tax=Nocardioides sp. TaxID=35761 RepID=UPI00352787B4
MKSHTKKAGLALAAAVALVAASTGGAVAGRLITSADVENNSLQAVDLAPNSVKKSELAPGTVGWQKLNQPTKARIKGLAGKAPVLKGAYYSVAFYDVGDTNAGAIATVACKAETDVAISGGVQVTGIGDTQEEINAANGRNTPVSSSFPGRMDWSTNSPRPDRLDGWVVQFGGNAGMTSDKAPAKAKVWALCVSGLEVPVEQTYTQSQ